MVEHQRSTVFQVKLQLVRIHHIPMLLELPLYKLYKSSQILCAHQTGFKDFSRRYRFRRVLFSHLLEANLWDLAWINRFEDVVVEVENWDSLVSNEAIYFSQIERSVSSLGVWQFFAGECGFKHKTASCKKMSKCQRLLLEARLHPEALWPSERVAKPATCKEICDQWRVIFIDRSR